jgi:hypothetical protein
MRVNIDGNFQEQQKVLCRTFDLFIPPSLLYIPVPGNNYAAAMDDTFRSC